MGGRFYLKTLGDCSRCPSGQLLAEPGRGEHHERDQDAGKPGELTRKILEFAAFQGNSTHHPEEMRQRQGLREHLGHPGHRLPGEHESWTYGRTVRSVPAVPSTR